MHVGIVLGSRSQWSTMQHTAELLANLGVAYEAHIITANKNTNRLQEYASKAVNRGLEIIIVGSTVKLQLREILASNTDIPVLDVPISKPVRKKKTHDSGSHGDADNQAGGRNARSEYAVNAALFAASLLAKKHPHIRNKLTNYQRQNTHAMVS